MPPTCVHLSSLLVISIETGEELKMKNEAGYLMSTSIKCLLGLFRDKYKKAPRISRECLFQFDGFCLPPSGRSAFWVCQHSVACLPFAQGGRGVIFFSGSLLFVRSVALLNSRVTEFCGSSQVRRLARLQAPQAVLLLERVANRRHVLSKSSI